jgi:diaminopimelate decarboxylase
VVHALDQAVRTLAAVGRQQVELRGLQCHLGSQLTGVIGVDTPLVANR